MALVSVDHLSKAYGRIRAVNDFSFEVQPSEIYTLVGPDGAGKTSIMRMLCGLLNPDSGRLSIAGHDVSSRLEEIKPLLGYMPQTFSLYPDLSVEENLIFYAGIYGVTGPGFTQRCEYLYTFSNLKPFSKRRAGALSGGMKQKLALSCALIHQPKLLVLDEPTAGVDPLSRRQFWEILLRFRADGVTILVSTPYMDEVARADRACLLFNGRKLSEGTPTELTALFDGRVFFLDAEPTVELVQRINTSPDLRARRFGSALHLYTGKDAAADDVVRTLIDAGMPSPQLREIPPDLEDCFIQLMERAT
ncbi:MAG TPA: ABC transporter ATP-binding protein [Candidatus Deferrimicrobium sp.]|nr:ABC transporter ATP-binding protein [Candidatus Deferrimicrobium sp.]